MFFKRDALKNFANFTGKHLYWSLFLIRRCFSVKFANFLKTAFSTYRTSPVAASACLKYKKTPHKEQPSICIFGEQEQQYFYSELLYPFYLRNCQLWEKVTHLATKIR